MPAIRASKNSARKYAARLNRGIALLRPLFTCAAATLPVACVQEPHRCYRRPLQNLRFICANAGSPDAECHTAAPMGRHRQLVAQNLLEVWSVSGHAHFVAEAVLEDLAVESAAADVQDPRRFLFVPGDRIEHAQDVGTLGLT
jgi:hypothetical protein